MTGLRGRALVTGGAGFMGSHVARHLLLRGYAVTVLDDLSGGFTENVPNTAKFVEGSILDRDLLDRLFAEGKFDYVFHLAAYAAEGLSPFIRHFNYQNNLIGSVNLINLSVRHQIQRFVFTSSIAVYGTNQLPMREDLSPHPEDPYGVSKCAVEMDLRCAHEVFGLQYTVFRPHNVYGEHQNIGDRYRNVIGIFMNQIMQGRPLHIFGDGTQTRGFSYIDDVAVPMVDCLDLPETSQEVFNIGADTPCSVNELAQTVMKAMERQVDIVHHEPRKEVLHAYADHSKLARYFPNLSKPLSLAEGVERMARWARAQGPRKTKLFAGVEVSKNLPESWKAELEGRA